MPNYYIRHIAILLFLVSLAQCSDPTSSGSGTLRIRITDAPFPHQFVRSVNLTISKVEIQPAGAPGFQSVSTTPRTFDLISLQNGVTDSLGIRMLPSSFYNAIRITVTNLSTELTDGRLLTIDIPDSLRDNGIVISLTPTVQIKAGQTTNLIMDIDVPRSLIVEGGISTANDITGFSFNPAIRVVNLNTVGQITGSIKHNNLTPGNLVDDVPMRSLPIFIIQSDTVDTISVVTNNQGEYNAFFLPAGTYTIITPPTDSTMAWRTPDVVVTTANPTRQDALLAGDK